MTERGRITCLAGRVLREAIEYDVEATSMFVKLWCAEFGLWGSGSTEVAALSELTSALTATWEDYLITPDPALGSVARLQKQRLRFLMGDLS